MNADTEKNGTEHLVTMRDRKSMEVHGVTDVVSFDEQAVILNTVCGNMSIEGDDLHIHVLNTEQGVVLLDGTIDSVTYEDTEPGKPDGKNGFFSKLFR